MNQSFGQAVKLFLSRTSSQNSKETNVAFKINDEIGIVTRAPCHQIAASLLDGQQLLMQKISIPFVLLLEAVS